MKVFAVAVAFVLSSSFLASSARASVEPIGGEAVASPPPPAHKHRDKRKSKRGSDEVHLGLLAGVGFPRPFSVGALFTVDKAFALGAEYAFMPTTQIGGVDLGFHAFALDMRIFPLQSSFFFGVRAGRQHLSGSANVDAGAYGTFAESMTMDTWFVNPRLGFLWTTSWGLTAGIDAGVQIPISHTTSSTLPPQAAIPDGVSGVASFFGARVIPSVTVLQLGVTF